MVKKWERHFWVLLGAGIIAWCLAMSIHASWSKTIVPRGPGGPPVVYEGDQYEIRVLIYDTLQNGMMLIYGSKEEGPVFFKSLSECEGFKAHDEKFLGILEGIKKTAHDQIGPLTRVIPICLPVQVGEKVD